MPIYSRLDLHCAIRPSPINFGTVVPLLPQLPPVNMPLGDNYLRHPPGEGLAKTVAVVHLIFTGLIVHAA